MGGAHSEREDFAKSANRPISYENALLSFGSRPLEKKCLCIGGIKYIFWGEAGTFGGEASPTPWIEA